jgi:hypothetical protein
LLPSRRAWPVHAQPSRPTTFRPPLDHADALAFARCLAKSPTHRRTEPPWPSSLTAAARPRWRPLRPNYGHHPILGEHVVEPDPSPVGSAAGLAGFRPAAPPPRPRVGLQGAESSYGVFCKPGV